MCSERSPLCPLASRRPRSARAAKRPYRSRRRHNAPRRKTRRTPARTPQPSGHPRIQPCPGRLDFPVLLGLQRTVRSCGARVGVVDECDAVADEDVVLDGHAFANERVAGDLAVLADVRVLLNFDKGTDLGVVAYFAAIEVDEPRQLDAFAQLHIGRNAEILAHSSIALPLSLSDRSAASSSLTTREPATPSFTGVSFLPTQSTK